MEWQPISTAPNDGTRVLVGRFTGDKTAMREGYVSVDWYGQLTDKRGVIGWGQFNGAFWPPTHWMPLPPPPTTE